MVERAVDTVEEATDGGFGDGICGSLLAYVDEGYVKTRLCGYEAAVEAVGFAATAAHEDAAHGGAQATFGNGDEEAVGGDVASWVYTPHGAPGVDEGMTGFGIGVRAEEAAYGHFGA